MVNPWKVVIDNTRIVQMVAPPWQVSEHARVIKITGYCMPWKDGLVFASMPGTDDLYILIFSTVAKLNATMKQAKIPFKSIKRIDDGPEFLDSIRSSKPPEGQPDRQVRIAVDPYYTKRGTVRYTEIL